MNKPNKTFSAGSIVVCANEVLLVCENGNFWGFPKGHIEANETESQAAAREIKEETGLTAFILVRKLGSYTRNPYTLDNQIDESEVKQSRCIYSQQIIKNLGCHSRPML